MIEMARYLGELGAGQVRLTPVPQATQPIRSTRTGRSHDAMMSRPGTIPHLDTAVPYRTTPAAP